MLGVQAGAMTPALASVDQVGACMPIGTEAVLLPGTGAQLTERVHAVVDASKPSPWARTRFGRQDTPQQHDLPEFAYKNRIAAANGATAGPQPAWDPV